jgi:hypothetical protein
MKIRIKGGRMKKKENKRKELIPALLKALRKLSKEKNRKAYSKEYENGLLNFIPYFQYYLRAQGIHVLAKDIVRGLGTIQHQPKASQKIKEIIGEIFLHMDSRDLKWLSGECDCPRCRGDKQGMYKEFLEMMKEAREEDDSSDEPELPIIDQEIKA